MSSATPHRIDPPGTPVPKRVGAASRRSAAGTAGNSKSGASQQVEAIARTADSAGPEPAAPDFLDLRFQRAQPQLRGEVGLDRETLPVECWEPASLPEHQGPLGPSRWLSLHAVELIDRLQAWAADLDAREAQLNARTSLQDHRERSSRLHQQDMATELAEQQRAIERLRQQVEVQARRLAFQSDPPDGASA